MGQGVRDQLGPSWSQLDQLGQVGRHLVVFRLLRKALLTKLDQVGPVLFPTVFRALPRRGTPKLKPLLLSPCSSGHHGELGQCKRGAKGGMRSEGQETSRMS